MGDFTKAYLKTGKNEGLWSKVPGDAGGQTWKGIAENSHPKWEGWQLVEFHKSGMAFPEKPVKADIDKLNILLNKDEKLELMVRKFYKKEFFDVMRGDEILDQGITEDIYDSCVNMGCHQSIVLTQRAWAVPETGKMEDVTLNKLNNKPAA